MHYLYGDCEDDTEAVLERYRKRPSLRLTFERFDTGCPTWRRGEYTSENMSLVRNEWVQQVLKEWPDVTHFWNVDSDVLPADDVLSRLLVVDKPVVGAYVPIMDGVTPIHMVAWKDGPFVEYESDMTGAPVGAARCVALGGSARRMGMEKTLTKPHRVTLLGGCYLIQREAIEAGLEWGPHAQGEDGYFGDKCRELGLEMWVDPLAKCQHVMKESK